MLTLVLRMELFCVCFFMFLNDLTDCMKTNISMGARRLGQEGTLACPSLENAKWLSIVIHCVNKLSYRRLITYYKTQFDFKCENCRTTVKMYKNNTRK